MMDLRYIPKHFCKEYLDIKGSSNLLVQFMATSLGIKKSYDDWFPVSKADKIKDLCEKYDLYYKFGWVFTPCRDIKGIIDGGKKIPTTKMFGEPYDSTLKEGELHVFFSKSKRNLELSYKNGWYPMIINNRAFHKPFIDFLRFGYFLGYPDCCINFFRKYNNHFKYNYLYQVLKNTKGNLNKFCNPLLKDYTFSYIYHMPCSYNCNHTKEYVNRLRNEIKNHEPELVKKIDKMTQKPFLVLGEQNTYIFQGNTKENRIIYEDFKFLGREDNDYLSGYLKEANELQIKDGLILFFNHKDQIHSIENKFGDKKAFILQFGD